jgi:protein translocase SecG subunit
MATVLGIFFIIVCVLLVLLVLIQKGRGGGLGAALGGFGSSAFGTKTGDMATVVTIVLAAIYLLIGVLATYAFSPDVGQLGLPLLQSPNLTGEELAKDTIQVPQATKIFGLSNTRGVTVRYAWDQQKVEDYDPPFPPEGLLVKFESGQRRRVMSLRAFREGFPSSEVRTVTFVRELEPAPSPEINPASKAISDPLEVTIVPGSDEVTTHYTLDGSEPSQESPLYEGPFTVQPGTTVKAVSFLDDHKPSVTVTENYSIAGAPEEDGNDEGSADTGDGPDADAGSDGADAGADNGDGDTDEAGE